MQLLDGCHRQQQPLPCRLEHEACWPYWHTCAQTVICKALCKQRSCFQRGLSWLIPPHPVIGWPADTGASLWTTDFLALSGDTKSPNNRGITSTPVIDQSTATIYVVAVTKDKTSALVNFRQACLLDMASRKPSKLGRATVLHAAHAPSCGKHPTATHDNPRTRRLHGLDLLTGAERLGSGVEVKPTVTTPKFDPTTLLQRPGLAFQNGVVYVAFGNGGGAYNGWLLSYNVGTNPYSLKGQLAIVQTNDGGGVWMSGAVRGGTICPS